MTNAALTATADSLMRAVIRSGAIRDDAAHHDHDVTLAVRIMREELKRFLSDDAKYADERCLAMTGQHGIAMASLVAECIRRIVAERDV